jgi:Holliday junction DNA helicase RuvA
MALGARFDAVAPLAEGDVPEVEALSETTVAPPVPAQGRASAQADALSALENLGYSRGEAAAAVATAAAEAPEGDTTALIRAALRLLAPKG